MSTGLGNEIVASPACQQVGVEAVGQSDAGDRDIRAQRFGIASDTVSMFLILEHRLQNDLAFARPHAPDFVRRKELWVVDESSFLLQRQKAQLDRMAIRAGAKLVYVGDALQRQGVEAGKPFELAQNNEITTAFMGEISRQKTSSLKFAVDILVGRDQLAPSQALTHVALAHNARAFAALDAAGMLREVRRGEAPAAMVAELMALSPQERARTIVITPYNRDRRDINDRVRVKLHEVGEPATPDQRFEVLESKAWTRAMTRQAQYYQAGDIVRLGRRYQAIGVEKGDYLRVAAVDAGRGIVHLATADEKTLAWEPRRRVQVEVYETQSRSLASGDLIRLTRNQDQFKNGEVIKVLSINGSFAQISASGGPGTATQQLDLAANKHWDHAYATTVHGAQGVTLHRAILHVPISEGEAASGLTNGAMARVFGDRSFYVGVTRASHELTIVTEDKAAAHDLVARQQGKRSAIEAQSKIDSFGKAQQFKTEAGR